MKATGIVRRVDDLGRIVIPKEIRRTLRIREGDPLLKTLRVEEKYLWAIKILQERIGTLEDSLIKQQRSSGKSLYSDEKSGILFLNTTLRRFFDEIYPRNLQNR